MAVKFPSPNLSPTQNDVYQVSEWSGGINTEAVGDELKQNESATIHNMTNDVKGQLSTARPVETYVTGITHSTVQSYVMIEAEGLEYIVAYKSPNSAQHTIEVFDVTLGSWGTALYTLPTTTTDVHLSVGSWAGDRVVYITYRTSDDDTNKSSSMLTVMYRRLAGILPTITATAVSDGSGNACEIERTTAYDKDWTAASGESPSFLTDLAVGDIICICEDQVWQADYEIEDAYFMARVVAVADDDNFSTDYIVNAGDTGLTLNTYFLHKLDIEWGDYTFSDGESPEGDLGWWVREGMPDGPDLYTGDHSVVANGRSVYLSGVTDPVADVYPIQDSASSFESGDTVVYGFSWVFKNGVNSSVTSVQLPIEDEDFEETFNVVTSFYSNIFPTGDDYQDIIGCNVWRKTYGEEEFGFYTYIPRMGIEAVPTISNWYDGIGLAYTEIDTGIRQLFQCASVMLFEAGSPAQSYVTKKFQIDAHTDDGSVLSETYRSVTGIYEWEAGAGMNGICSVAYGDRIFVAAPFYPVGGSDTEYQDDTVRYSLIDGPMITRSTNVIDYRSGAADKAVGLARHGGDLYVFKRNSVIVIDISSPNDYEWTPKGEWSVGLLAGHLVTDTKSGPVWCSDEGIFTMGKNGPTAMTNSIRTQYMSMSASPSSCFIGFDAYRNRLYFANTANVYNIGMAGTGPGWKLQTFRVDAMGQAPDGRLTYLYRDGVDSVINYFTEVGDSNPATGSGSWQLGSRFAGTPASKVKFRKAYVAFDYEISGSGDAPVVTLYAFVDGSLTTSQQLTLTSTSGSLVEEVRLSGKGRSFDIRLTFVSTEKELLLTVKRVDLVIRRKRAK